MRNARGVCSAILVFESIVVMLASFVARDVAGVRPGVSVSLGAALALGCLFTPALLRRRSGFYVGSVLQVLILASGLVVPAMFFIGGLFVVFWFLALYLAHRIEVFKTAEPADPPGS